MKTAIFYFIIISILSFYSSTSAKTFYENKKSEKELIELANQNIEKFRKGDVSIIVKSKDGKPLSEIDIEIEQTSHDFKFGSIIFELTGSTLTTPEMEKEFKNKFTHLFNMAIFPFYWDGYEYIPGKPNWQKIEEVAKWCHNEGITCKGHPLAWTNIAGTPAWLYDIPAEDATSLLKARIIENVKGFKGSIDIWDVVNEAVNTVLWEKALELPDRNNDARYSMFKYSIDEIADWVAPCYKWAHEANPDANLILNEFGQIAIPGVRDRFFALVNELKRRDVPLSGIGLQAHEPRLVWYNPDDVWETLEKYSELGLPIHFTEFHPHSNPFNIEGGFMEGKWSPENQAAFAEMMYTLAFGHPSVVSFCWWDFTENDSYIKGSALLEKDLSPKPAYKMLDELINKKWKTKITEKTDKDLIKFRGFYGKYNVSIKYPNGEKQCFNFTNTPQKENIWEIQLSQ
ncbi:MAG: endo-1,4-beta-xylanase [Prolixibacteraceae bacterium]|nr:endo-1,4-beta-xylanase [Prolixibacteraceae bacterium]MBN2775201.1 endo-1,4-beta-xylanase [Prolixibacteraceae bacterium]